MNQRIREQNEFKTKSNQTKIKRVEIVTGGWSFRFLFLMSFIVKPDTGGP